MLAAVASGLYQLTYAATGNHGRVALEMILYPGIRTAEEASYAYIRMLKFLSRIILIRHRKSKELCWKDVLLYCQ
jgi:hypothetical protein